jgi:hypothetical protein
VGLVVLDYCCKDILKISDFSEAILIIEEKLKGIKDLECFNKDLNKIYISKKLLETARESLRTQMNRERQKKIKN